VSAVARWLGRVAYEPTWRAMQRYTDTRDSGYADELWCLEHPPVYTLGMNADRSHVLAPGDIPVVPIDRGGQVTYHGPGQLVVYPLLDLKRLQLGVRALVTALESALVALAADCGVEAVPRREAPGVYVRGAKLASIGLRVRRGCSYHGLALNVAMNLEPFSRINPCGHAGLAVVDLATLGAVLTPELAARRLVPHLARTLGLAGGAALAVTSEPPSAATGQPSGRGGAGAPREAREPL
jgi:lipoyl(octanoyl) transferase